MVSGIKTRQSTFPSLDIDDGHLEPPWSPTQPVPAHTKTRLDGIQREVIFDQFEDRDSAEKSVSMRYESQSQEPNTRSIGLSRNTEEDQASAWWYQILACIGADRSPSQNRTKSIAASSVNAPVPADRIRSESVSQLELQTAEKNGRSESPTSSPRNSFDSVGDRFAEHGDVAEAADGR